MSCKILVVEDNESIRKIVKMTLEADSYEVLEADDGMKAIHLLKDNSDCALVITDLAMPVLDGYELLRRLRKDDAYKDLPVFVLSAEQDASSMTGRGATRVIRKPFSPIDLLDAVRDAVQ